MDVVTKKGELMVVCLRCGTKIKPLWSPFCSECMKEIPVGVIAIVTALREEVFDEAAQQLGGKE